MNVADCNNLCKKAGFINSEYNNCLLSKLKVNSMIINTVLFAFLNNTVFFYLFIEL